jgi:PAS domain S-box-containing protein
MDLELSRLVDALPGLVWTALPDGRAEFLNQSWCGYTGLSIEEASGFGWHSAVHPGDRPALLEAWGSFIEAGRAGEFEARLRRHDGEYRRFLFSAAPIRDESGRIVKWCGTNTDIEDRIRAEEGQALRQILEAQRLSQTGSFTADIWADKHNWSEELYRIFELEPGTPISVQTIRGMLHPEDVTSFDTRFARAVAERTDYNDLFRITTASGKQKHLHAVAQFADAIAGRPLFIGAIRDVTEGRAAADALAASEAELRAAYGRLTEAQRVSKTGSFTWDVLADQHNWSDEIYRIFGIEPGAKVSMATISAAVHPEDMPMVEAVLGRAAEGGDFDLFFRIRQASGEVKHAHVVAHRMEQIADRAVFIGALQDVTESKLADEALARARAELAHVARVTALSALTASIAHEVNQPLAGIITNASTCLRMLAADPPNLEGAKATAQRTIRDGNRASEVIQRLRGLFARKQPSLEPVDLNEAAREVLALSATELQRGRVVVTSAFADNLPPVQGDRVQLQQVILNLVLNAADAMSQVDGRSRDLVVETRLDGAAQVILSVSDSGVGIDAGAVERLFDPFYSTKDKGMGIGLSISRSIIEGHEGRLWATANEGDGATFSFSLPCQDLQA